MYNIRCWIFLKVFNSFLLVFLLICVLFRIRRVSAGFSLHLSGIYFGISVTSILPTGTVLRSKMLKKYPMEPEKNVPVTMMGYSALKPQNYDDVLRKYKLL
jgi:hypothetical protein